MSDTKIIADVAYSTRPNLNSGPLSDSEITDIAWGVAHGRTVAYLADFLCRSEAEVAEQIDVMGLTPPSGAG